MDSILVSGSGQERMQYTAKQQKLINDLSCVVSKIGIDLEIDPIAYEIQSPAALDIEHDEQGEMVGIGIYDGVKAYYFTKITAKLKEILEK